MRSISIGRGAMVIVVLGLLGSAARTALAQSSGAGGRSVVQADRPRGEEKSPEKRNDEPRPQAPQPPAPPPPQRPRVIPMVRFEATVFKVEMPKERIVELDGPTLAAAGSTPAKLMTALEALGPTEPMYRVDQNVALDGGRNSKIEMSRDVPYVSGMQKTQSGEPVPQMNRCKMGAEFELFGSYPNEDDKQRLFTTLHVQLSGLSTCGNQAGDGPAAPMFWRVEQSHGGAAELGKPFVLISADSGTTAGCDKTQAFVTLVTLRGAGQK